MKINDIYEAVGSWLGLLILGSILLFFVGIPLIVNGIIIIKKILPILLIVVIAFVVIKYARKGKRKPITKFPRKKCIRCGRPVSNKRFRYCSRCWRYLKRRR